MKYTLEYVNLCCVIVSLFILRMTENLTRNKSLAPYSAIYPSLPAIRLKLLNGMSGKFTLCIFLSARIRVISQFEFTSVGP